MEYTPKNIPLKGCSYHYLHQDTKNLIKHFFPKKDTSIEPKEAAKVIPKSSMCGRVDFEKFKSLDEELFIHHMGDISK